MKRGRKTRISGTSKGGKELVEAEEDQNSNFGSRSITELPRCISIDILLRLYVNRLLVCRCVCETWRYLVSDLKFAKLYFAKGEVYPLIQSLSWVQVSRTPHLVEPPEHRFNCDPQGCTCQTNWLLFEVHPTRKLEKKLKIPLRNSDLAINANCNNCKRKTQSGSRQNIWLQGLGRRALIQLIFRIEEYLGTSSYQGHVLAALVLGGVDVTGPHLHIIYPHGSTDTLPYATMGSDSLAAMAIFKSKYHEWLMIEMAQKTQNGSLRNILEKDKLSRMNFLDCHRNLRIVLRQEKKMYVLELPIPAEPEGYDVTFGDLRAHRKFLAESNDVTCLMLSSMTSEIQKK